MNDSTIRFLIIICAVVAVFLIWGIVDIFTAKYKYDQDDDKDKK